MCTVGSVRLVGSIKIVSKDCSLFSTLFFLFPGVFPAFVLCWRRKGGALMGIEWNYLDREVLRALLLTTVGVVLLSEN